MIKFIVSLGLLTLAASNAGAVTVMGQGNNKCSDWITEEAEGTLGISEAWVTGFMSGLAIGDQDDFLKMSDVDSITNAVTAACKLKPDESIAKTVLSIVAKMEK
jgi:hypothetical protein